jgi:hypothetical protein
MRKNKKRRWLGNRQRKRRETWRKGNRKKEGKGKKRMSSVR